MIDRALPRQVDLPLFEGKEDVPQIGLVFGSFSDDPRSGLAEVFAGRFPSILRLGGTVV